MTLIEVLGQKLDQAKSSEFDLIEALIYSYVFSIRWILVGGFGGLMTAAILAQLPAMKTLQIFFELILLVGLAEFGLRLALQRERF